MAEVGSSAHEAARLAAVRRYDILDTPPDGAFDRVTAVAAEIFAVPIAIISIVDEDRIWFKSAHGLDVAQIDRAPGLCASAILQDDVWLLNDAAADPRSLANPLVAGDFGLRFYVGVPLRTSDGYNLGTLCVIDREARAVSEHQLALLRNLAGLVVDQLELRLAARRAVFELSQALADKDAALVRAEMMAKEIDHRVMNSLQLVSAMLNVQSRALGSSDAASQLSLAANRITAIAQVHRHIYQTDSVGVADCKTYLEALCADLRSILVLGEQSEISVRSDDARVPTAQVVPLGLIVAEFVTNSAKYGASRIVVRFRHDVDGHCLLEVFDDGRGLPAGFDPAAMSGLGMKVVGALARQLEGRLSFDNFSPLGGARFGVEFPCLG